MIIALWAEKETRNDEEWRKGGRVTLGVTAAEREISVKADGRSALRKGAIFQHVLTGTSAMTTDSLETIFQDCRPREWRDFQWTLCRAWPRLSGQGILLPWRHNEYEAKPGDGSLAELWWKCYMCNFIQVPHVSRAPSRKPRAVNAYLKNLIASSCHFLSV